MSSIHSESVHNQRGIPPLITDLLERFGQSQYDGHGGVVRFFNTKSVRKMKKPWVGSQYGALPNGSTPTKW